MKFFIWNNGEVVINLANINYIIPEAIGGNWSIVFNNNVNLIINLEILTTLMKAIQAANKRLVK